jgi:hypothetical protein
LTVFSGVIYLDGKPLTKKGTITALLVGYREIPLSERIKEHIPTFDQLPDELRDTLIRHDQDRRRSDIGYKLAASEEVSVVEGRPYEYEGASTQMEGRVAHRSSFYEGLTIPEEKGEGEYHYVRFQLELEEEVRPYGEDVMKVGTGDISGLTLHFLTKTPITLEIDTAVPVSPDGEEINLERG